MSALSIYRSASIITTLIVNGFNGLFPDFATVCTLFPLPECILKIDVLFTEPTYRYYLTALVSLYDHSQNV